MPWRSHDPIEHAGITTVAPVDERALDCRSRNYSSTAGAAPDGGGIRSGSTVGMDMRGPQACVLSAAILAATVWASGCGEKATEPAVPTPPAPRPTTVTVTPSTAQLAALGATVQLAAEVRDQTGRVMVGVSVSWASADTLVASVDPIGLVTAVSSGTTVVTAAAGDVTGQARVSVMQSAGSVVVTPPTVTIAVGDTLRLVAEAFDANAHPIEGAAFNWSTSDPSVARVDGTGLLLGVAEGAATIAAATGSVRGTADITVADPPPKPGPGVNIFDFPMRAVAVGGFWGGNRRVGQAWENEGRQGPLIPLEFIAWLRSMHVNWVMVSVALHYDDSMDSTVSLETGRDRQVPTWEDDTLRQVLREFRERGFNVYMTLAFEAHEAERSSRPVQRWQLGDPAPPHTGGVPPGEGPAMAPENWPWRPDHPDHERFVAEFWETYTEHAEHFAALAEDEGVALFSLGTETDRLFRSRPDHHDPGRPASGYMTNDFGDELRSMVDRVRAVYSGRLTYDMHASTLMYADFHGRGSGAGHLWEDLDLDIVGISAWFRLAAAPPATVMSVPELQASYESVFRDLLRPLADRNPGRAIVFLEYGAMDLVEAPANPGSSARQGESKTFVDMNRNGLDDGEETQANILDAFFRTGDRQPGLVNGVFLWDNWIGTDAMYAERWRDRLFFTVRGKLAEAVVRDVYGRWAGTGR